MYEFCIQSKNVPTKHLTLANNLIPRFIYS